MASWALAVDGEVEEGEQQALADAAPAPARVDGEGRDVRLVDHEPHPAVRRHGPRRPGRRGSGPAGSTRSRCGRRGPARATRSSRARWRGRPRGRRAPSARCAASPGVARPCHLPAPASTTPRGRVTYSGTSVGEVAASPLADRSRAGPEARRACAEADRARAAPPATASAGARPSRSTAIEALARRRDRASRRPSGGAAGGPGPARGPGRSGPAGMEQDDRRSPPAAPAMSASAVETPTSGIPSPWARPLAVAIPTRRPVNAPGPVPTTIPVEARPADVLLAEEPADRRQQRLAVAIAGLPGRDRHRRPRPGDPVATTTRDVAVSMARIAGRRPSWVIAAASR